MWDRGGALGMLIVAALVAGVVTPGEGQAQQRIFYEGLPDEGWLDEWMVPEGFVAAADLWGAAWSRLLEARDDQVGLEGVISARLRGGASEDTFLRLRSELIVPLLFGTNDEPTRTEQPWQGQHAFDAQMGVGSYDAAALELLLEGHFYHSQEPTQVGLPLDFATTDLDEVMIGFGARLRLASQGGGAAGWHQGAPLIYRYRRRAYGGASAVIDRRAEHEVSLGFDARSYGRGAEAGQLEWVGASYRRVFGFAGSGGAAAGIVEDQVIDLVELRALTADLYATRGAGLLWRLRGGLGWRFYWNQSAAPAADVEVAGVRDSDHAPTLWAGALAASPGRYQLGLAARLTALLLAPDVRVPYTGSRLEATALIDPRWFGVGLAHRGVLDQACDAGDWACFDADARRLALHNEASLPLWTGSVGVFYRVQRGARAEAGSDAAPDWQLRDEAAAWSHEVGLFWRTHLAYEPLDPSAI